MANEDAINQAKKAQNESDMGFDADWLDELTDAFDSFEIDVAEKAEA